MATWREPVEVGRGDVNPHGIPVANPHEIEGPDFTDRETYPDVGLCIVCGEVWCEDTRCDRCKRSIEEDRLRQELGG